MEHTSCTLLLALKEFRFADYNFRFSLDHLGCVKELVAQAKLKLQTALEVDENWEKAEMAWEDASEMHDFAMSAHARARRDLYGARLHLRFMGGADLM